MCSQARSLVNVILRPCDFLHLYVNFIIKLDLHGMILYAAGLEEGGQMVTPAEPVGAELSKMLLQMELQLKLATVREVRLFPFVANIHILRLG